MQKIMFNDKYGLTNAVLDEGKTMTRRLCKYDRPSNDWEIGFPCFDSCDYDEDNNCISPLCNAFGWHNNKTGEELAWNIPKYRIGEIVAIAQSYSNIVSNILGDKELILKLFTDTRNTKGWKNKMFVKALLMPHYIQITNIKIERLQDISNEDCLKEGITDVIVGCEYMYGFANMKKGDYDLFKTPREAYSVLIDKISGKGTWESNPYVFVYEFKLMNNI